MTTSYCIDRNPQITSKTQCPLAVRWCWCVPSDPDMGSGTKPGFLLPFLCLCYYLLPDTNRTVTARRRRKHRVPPPATPFADLLLVAPDETAPETWPVFSEPVSDAPNPQECFPSQPNILLTPGVCCCWPTQMKISSALKWRQEVVISRGRCESKFTSQQQDGTTLKMASLCF